MAEDRTYHIPVLLKESVDGMNLQPDSVCVDVTFGGGGHSREILSRLSDEGHLYGFDQDKDAERNILASEKFTFVYSNFRYLKNFLRYYGVGQVDALIADLGVSSHDFDEKDRGFSFRFNGRLDMRMNTNARRTAAEIVNTYDEKALADLFYLYGELKQGHRLAAVIVKARERRPFETVDDFLAVVRPVIGERREKKDLAKVFQALRIEVNDEMGALKDMLRQASDVLRPGGRLVVITYHSLEDRLVKNAMKCGNTGGDVEKDFYGNIVSPYRLINNKVIIPDESEIERNPRSRSAKLRIAEKK